MSVAFVSGVVGILILGLSGIPQAVRVVRHGTAGISYPGTIVITSVDGLWTAWSIGFGLLAPAISDSLGVTLSTVVLVITIHQQRRNKSLAVLWAMSLIVTGILLGAAQPIAAGIFAFSLSCLWRSLQLREVFRADDISGVSTGLWILNTLGQFAWTVHGIAIGNTFMAATTFALGIFAGVVAAAIIVKRRKRADREHCDGLINDAS